MQDLQALVDAADEAALLRAVDGLCAAREWDRLVDLAGRCREAVEFGRQLWGVAMHVDYRLALEAPAPHAASVVRTGAGRFTLGPLTEVAASRHEWAALAPHLPEAAPAAAVAQERVLRQEDLRGRADVGVEMPPCLATYEPSYALPVYRDRSATFPQPEAATRSGPPPRAVRAGQRLPDDDAVEALRAVTEEWVTGSSGRSAALVVDGDAHGAVAAFTGEASLLEISPAEALAVLQWSGASGGAHGRRRGGAAGRFAAWWAAAALTGLPWPDEAGADFVKDLGAALDDLWFYRWRPPGAESGWVLRLAVAAPEDGLAWAVEALDQRDDEPDSP